MQKKKKRKNKSPACKSVRFLSGTSTKEVGKHRKDHVEELLSCAIMNTKRNSWMELPEFLPWMFYTQFKDTAAQKESQ